MITALISSLFVGLLIGGASGGGQEIMFSTLDHWESSIKKHVDDDQRKEKALSLIEQAKKDILKYEEPVSKKLTVYYKDDNDYITTLEQYKNDLLAVNKKWKHVDKWMLDLRYEMKDLLSTEEFYKVIGRVQNRSDEMLKDKEKSIAKAEKALNKKIKKYNKKFGKSYKRPEPLKEIAPELLDKNITDDVVDKTENSQDAATDSPAKDEESVTEPDTESTDEK